MGGTKEEADSLISRAARGAMGGGQEDRSITGRVAVAVEKPWGEIGREE